MTDSNKNREASATIRGYIYQFDATIRKILVCNAEDSCIVEDVEDFDIHSSDFASYFQCKFYAAQKLTASTLRDAILPMLKNYVSLCASERDKKQYHLYGHFKETAYINSSLTTDEVKTILVRREQVQDESGRKSYKVFNIQEEIGVTDDDIEGFVKQFKLEFGAEYEVHKRTVINEIAEAIGVSSLEAEIYIYPSALTLISTIACNDTAEKRTITKGYFLGKIKPNKTLYSLWSLREKSQKSYCREMRSRYFCCRNIDPEARFFILDFPDGTSQTEIIQTLIAIRKKWSSHTVRRKPEGDRYAPYIFLRNTPNNRLSSIKKSLHQNGCVFVDGYPFQGADFSLSSISQKQTYQNGISLRFINCEADLHGCLSGVAQHKSIYQFFIQKPLDIELDIFQVCIPIKNVNMIADII